MSYMSDISPLQGLYEIFSMFILPRIRNGLIKVLPFQYLNGSFQPFKFCIGLISQYFSCLMERHKRTLDLPLPHVTIILNRRCVIKVQCHMSNLRNGPVTVSNLVVEIHIQV